MVLHRFVIKNAGGKSDRIALDELARPYELLVEQRHKIRGHRFHPDISWLCGVDFHTALRKYSAFVDNVLRSALHCARDLGRWRIAY